jgi:hypothetical protein
VGHEIRYAILQSCVGVSSQHRQSRPVVNSLPDVIKINFCWVGAVRQFGGSLSAPGRGELALWWREAKAAGGDVVSTYGFLNDVLRDVVDLEVLLRGTATIELRQAR